MFLGTLERENADKDYLSKIFQQVITFLNSIGPQAMASGTYPLQYKDIYQCRIWQRQASA